MLIPPLRLSKRNSLVAVASRLQEKADAYAREQKMERAFGSYEALLADPDIDAVALVHHETTTGLLNPVHEIAALAGARGVRVIVDAISSLGAEELRLAGAREVFGLAAVKTLRNDDNLPKIAASPRSDDVSDDEFPF